MKAIVTKFVPATNTRGAHVSAVVEYLGRRHRRTYPWQHELNADENHAHAAQSIATDLKWYGTLIEGALPDGKSYAWVFTHGINQIRISPPSSSDVRHRAESNRAYVKHANECRGKQD